MKKYCKNCSNNNDDSDVYCFAEIIKNEYTGDYSFGNKSMNKTGDCTYYKRKFWKFWIKNEEKEGVIKNEQN